MTNGGISREVFYVFVTRIVMCAGAHLSCQGSANFYSSNFGTGAKPMTSIYTKVLRAMFCTAIFLGVGIALANAAIPPMMP